MAVPAISSIVPSHGPTGISVVLTGVDLASASSVTFDQIPAASFIVNSATQITAVVPAEMPSGPGRVVVVTPGGTNFPSVSLVAGAPKSIDPGVHILSFTNTEYKFPGWQHSVKLSDVDASVLGGTLPEISPVEDMAVSVLEGATYKMQANAFAGSGTKTYQWYRNDVVIGGATSSTYTYTGTAGHSGSKFNCKVTNSVGSVMSKTTTVTITGVAPTISVQPASATKANGATNAFSVTAAGTSPLVYQWKKGAANVGTNSNAYTTPALAFPADNGSTYTVTVTNAYGTVTSAVATLTVTA